MAHLIDVEKLKAEIERRYKKFDGKTGGIAIASRLAYLDVLSFLDTLEEQERPEPYNPVYDEAYLNEKIKKATESWKGVDVNKMLAECRGYDEPKVDLEKEVEKYFQGLWPGMETAEQCNTDMHFTPPAIMRLAHHFAVWGAEHASGKEKKVDLEKEECELVTADEDIITIHLGKVLTEEQYDAVLRSVIDHLNKHWSHILQWS